MQIAPLFLALLLAACSSHAESVAHHTAGARSTADPCDDFEPARDGRTRVCESRTVRIDRTDIALDAHVNGSVHVSAWDRDYIELVSRVEAEAGTRATAERLVRETRVLTGGTVRVDAPETERSGRRSDWVNVHFDVHVPRDADVSVEAFNGAIVIEGVSGRLRANTLNGSLRIVDAGGEVDAETVNGAIQMSLTASAARGEGVRAHTTNGAVAVTLPSAFSADVRARTVMGSIRFDDALGVRDLDCGRDDCRRLSGVIGRGGAPLDVSTTNGSVRLRAR